MTIDLLIALSLRAMLALNVGVVLVLLLRRPVLRRLGARSAYLFWSVPLAMTFAALLPMSNMAIRVLPAIAVSARSIAAALAPPTIDQQPRLSIMLLSLWLSGACIAALVLWWQQQRFVQSFGELQRRDFGWLSQTDDAGPALVGALRPRIVLPADFSTRYDARERQLILAHEAVHLRRGDAQINALIALLRCLNWFNPLIHYAASRLRFDQEVACDAAVLRRFPESARVYAGAMLRTQLGGESRQELRLPIGCHWPSDHPLKERIMLLKKPIPTLVQSRLASIAIAAVIVSVSAVTWAAQADPRPAADLAQPIRVGEIVNATPSENVSYRMMRPPKYPPEAVEVQASAKIILKVQVDAAGKPVSIDVEKLTLIDNPERPALSAIDKAALSDAFTQTSIDAIMNWKFNPGITDGKAIGGYVLIPVDFSITDDDCEGAACNAAPAAKS